jgi:tRNA pseudouridine38-40 synthase
LSRTVRLDVAYDGTDFKGFQPQPGLRTVGGELERALQRLTGASIRVTPAGRTDSGVHAQGQVVSFRTESGLAVTDLKRGLNALVGRDLAVTSVGEADERFNARRSAKSRRYRYRIWNHPDRNVWQRRWTAQVDTPLDLTAMQDACTDLLGQHDFAGFRTHRSQDDEEMGTIRRVMWAEWQRAVDEPSLVSFEIEADAFLRHMVRTVVGSALLIGQHKLPVSALAEMLEGRERSGSGPTAPASGLTLMEVTY